jgi:SET domain-containing protein
MKISKAMASCPDFLEIRPSKNPAMGLGVFAKRDLKEGTVLGKYEGEILTKRQYAKRYSDAIEEKWSQLPETQKFFQDVEIWKKNKRVGPPPAPIPPLIFEGGHTGLYLLSHGKKTIDAEDPELSNWTRYINHKPRNKQNNVFYTCRANIKTVKKIKAGTELFADYGKEYFYHRHFVPF